MRISEALEKVSQSYAPGVAEYYNRFTPDPWFEAHERFEQVILLQDDAMTAAAGEEFVAECKRLVERFQRDGKPARGVSAASALYMGDEKRVKARQSVRYQECAGCGTKENLTLQAIGPEALEVQVICRQCKGAA